MKPVNPKTGARSSAIKTQIDENLKRVYQQALTGEVPDRFVELLAQLKAKESQQ
ncbi:MAG: transcriptional regulator [Rhodobacterales bacterium]|nr:transcriptional regulator [Rhodobacterales bacterium]MDX5499132.1 transcriptional regulator [Rhodobacterales bacterium]